MPPSDDPKRFTVIQGGEEKRKISKRDRDDIEQLICRICEHDTGVASSEIIVTVICPMEKRGEIMEESGTKRGICVSCLSRGKITYLI